MKTLGAWVVLLVIALAGCGTKDAAPGDRTASKSPGANVGRATPPTETDPAPEKLDPPRNEPVKKNTPSPVSGGSEVEASFADVEGKWNIRITPEMRKQMDASKVSGVELSLTFSAPDRFAMTAKSNEKGSQTVVGTAKVEGGKILLTPTEIDGKPPVNPSDAQTLGLTLDSAKATLTSEDGRMTFERGK